MLYVFKSIKVYSVEITGLQLHSRWYNSLQVAGSNPIFSVKISIWPSWNFTKFHCIV